MTRLTNRVAVVTGGASGIGRGAALRLAAEGAAVEILDKNDASAVCEEIRVAGGIAYGIVCDVSCRKPSRKNRHPRKQCRNPFRTATIPHPFSRPGESVYSSQLHRPIPCHKGYVPITQEEQGRPNHQRGVAHVFPREPWTDGVRRQQGGCNRDDASPCQRTWR